MRRQVAGGYSTQQDPHSSLRLKVKALGLSWVAVKELKLSYYIGETLLFSIYTHYGNLIQIP